MIEQADITHLIAAISGTLGGGAGVGFIAKLFAKSWLKRHDRNEKTLEKAVELLTRLDERVKSVQEGQNRMVDHAIKIAVLEERTEKNRNDLNGLGTKIRGITQQ